MEDENRIISLVERDRQRKRKLRRERLHAMLPPWRWVAVAVALGVAFALYSAFGTNPYRTADVTSHGVHAGGIQACGVFRRTCLVDGDTGWQDGVKWRLQHVDTPELGRGAACARERELAQEALERLTALMADGYGINRSGGKDRYGRELVDIVLKDGRDAGRVLMAEGLAQPWPNRGNIWCGL